jgi:HlyD family secretion protein
MAKKNSKRKYVVFLVLGALVAGGWGWSKYVKRDPPTAISKEKVARRNLTEIVVANGKIEPVLQVKISPEVSGEIIALPIKEGQCVKKGDLLFKIKPDNYLAASNSATANFNYAVANRDTAAANLEKAGLEYARSDALFKAKLISDSDFLTAKNLFDVAKSTLAGATEQVSIARAQSDSAAADFSKTTVYAPLTGTISKLNSQLGERVVGTATMAGTEVMTVADLNTMEARVDIGEIDVPLIHVGEKALLEVDSFKDQKFDGIVTEIANSANNNDTSTTAATSTDATKFQVKIRVQEKEPFLPGMSVTADIETRYRTNVLTIPIQSVTTRLPDTTNNPAKTNSLAVAAHTNTVRGTNAAGGKLDELPKPIEVVFVMEGDHVKVAPVKRGISDDNYVEILDGLSETNEVVSGGYKAINRDLEDGKKVVINVQAASKDKETKTY